MWGSGSKLRQLVVVTPFLCCVSCTEEEPHGNKLYPRALWFTGNSFLLQECQAAPSTTSRVSWKWESLGPRQQSLQDFIQSCLRGSQEGTDTTWAEAMCFPFSFSLLHPSPESSACRLALQVTGASQDCFQYRAENLLYQSKKLCKFMWPETEINHALHSRRDYWWLSSGWWCEGICASLNPR